MFLPRFFTLGQIAWVESIHVHLECQLLNKPILIGKLNVKSYYMHQNLNSIWFHGMHLLLIEWFFYLFIYFFGLFVPKKANSINIIKIKNENERSMVRNFGHPINILIK